MARAAIALLAVSLALGCSAGPEVRPTEEPAPSVPRASAQSLMDPCWPGPGAPGVVKLDLIVQSGVLKDVFFETREGATNADARCLRALVFAYPWEKGSIPPTIEVRAPTQIVSGWAVLEHVRLLTTGVIPPTRGLIDPAPLVAACLAQGQGLRPGQQVSLQASPVRVTLMHGEAEVRPVTGSERCLLAVLGSSLYPGTRTFRFSFDSGKAPRAAPAEEVHWYFDPPKKVASDESLGFEQIRQVVATAKPKVGDCWEAALGRRAGLFGGRSWRFYAQPSGEVTHVEVTTNLSDSSDEAADYFLDRCIAKALYATRIPPEGRGGVGSYSWVFAQR